jgi:hypothetical protein
MINKELNQQTEQNIRFRVLLGLGPWIALVFIVGISLLKDCFRPPDPMDDSINAGREIVRHLEVCDTTRNGFRIVYATTQSVTSRRLDEIRSRKQLNDAFDSLQQTAATFFGGSLLQTDIYDFAAYARRFDVDNDVRMHNIFVFGKEKQEMYVRPNPKIKNSATWINTSLEQGIQYIRQDDIYFRRKKAERVYRYWKCYGNNAISTTDERFSHFSEAERLW